MSTTSWTYNNGETREGSGCSNCGASYYTCTKKLLNTKSGKCCCGLCSYTDTHHVVEVTPAEPTKHYEKTFESFRQWSMDTAQGTEILHAFEDVVDSQPTPKKGEVWKIQCVHVDGPEEPWRFYMLFDGKEFVDGASNYELSEVILHGKIGEDSDK